MKFLRAEVWDKMQYLFRNYYDRMIHSVLCFDGIIDEKKFREALSFQVANVPILHSVYHNNFVRPFWVVKDYTIDDVLTVADSKNVDEDVNNFITGKISIKNNVQIKIAMFKHDQKTTVCFMINHMCFDGGDLKYFITTLCSNYTKLCSGDKNLMIKSGSRAYTMIYSSLSDADKKIAKGLYKNVSVVKNKNYFPLTPTSSEDRGIIKKHVMPTETFLTVKRISKELGVTINDLFLTAYFQSLYEIGKFDKDEVMTIPNMIDLRRYLKDGVQTGLTNHTGFMPCTLHGIGDNVEQTLQKVVAAIKLNKDDKFLGLYSLPLLHLAYTVFPHFISEPAIMLGYDNPLIGMSNIGIMVPQQYKLGNLNLIDGFMTGAIKNKPFMQLALTTLNDAVTFTIAVCGNKRDEEILEKFFRIYDRNIEELIAFANSKKVMLKKAQ